MLVMGTTAIVLTAGPLLLPIGSSQLATTSV